MEGPLPNWVIEDLEPFFPEGSVRDVSLEKGKCSSEKAVGCVKERNERRITLVEEKVREYDAFRYLLLLAHELKHIVDIANNDKLWDEYRKHRQDLEREFPGDPAEQYNRHPFEGAAIRRQNEVLKHLRGKYGR